MVSKHSSIEITKDTSTSEKDTTAAETNMTFQNDNPAFHFCGPQFIVNSKGNALNVELDLHDYEDTQNEPDIPSSINVHPFHGGDTQQWLVHDDANGGAAIMSKFNKKYVVPTPNGGISSRHAPYFWKISKGGQGYSFSIESPETNLSLCLLNTTATLGMLGAGYENVYILRSTLENYTAVRKSQFMTLPEPTAQFADAHTSTCTKTLKPAFSELALGLPPHYILDTIATGRECSGFPTGFFRVRAAGSSHYWTLSHEDSFRDGNFDGNGLLLWEQLPNSVDSQSSGKVFYINIKGELCLYGGHVDASGNALILAKTRAPTVPWPNPWSHPLPTFTYSEETKCISVKFYADPYVSGRWPRAEKEWKDKEFLVAAQCTENVKVPSFDKVLRWAPSPRFVERQWTKNSEQWKANDTRTLGVEEKPQPTEPEQGYPTRLRWELEEV